jgi:hypothetical protein
MKVTFKIPWCLAMLVPLAIRNSMITSTAAGDARVGFYACRDRVTRWLSHYVAWDPVNNEIHKAVVDLLELPAAFATWQAERDAVEKDLATRANYYALVTVGTLLFVSDVLSNVLLLKSLGVEEGLRRILMAFAVAAVLFAIPVLVAKFAASSKLFSWIIGILGLVLVVVISIVQLQQTASTGTATLADYSGAILLSFAVVGPAALAKLVLGSWLPVAQLRAERRRLRRLQETAKTAQAAARSYVIAHHEYTDWYKSNAKQIASEYRPAFAREYLRGNDNHDQLATMIAADDQAIERELATVVHTAEPPAKASPEAPAQSSSVLKLVPKNAADELARLEAQFGKRNPYRKQS